MNSQNPDAASQLMSRGAGIALLAFLFVTGFVLMGFEMLGSRYLNPWFGGGITTWASLISVVLLAMMVGYMSGGTIADRSTGLTPMAVAIFIAGLNMLAVAIFADGWMESILDTIGDGFWGVLAGSMILCFLPVMCLAGLSPYVVKMLLREISHGGRITGLVYSVSTAGNIVGTLATTFWLIPTLGTRSITRIFAAILIVLAIALLVQSRRRIGVVATALAVAVLASPLTDVRTVRAETASYAASYPEGPLWVGKTLYYAEMTADRISKIENGKRSDFWKETGCGPTAITEFGPDGFAIACHLGGKVTIINRTGHTLSHITHASDGRPLRNPNDINSQGGGPVFFSDPGPFDPNAEASGRVYRLDRDGIVHLVHEGLKYPNGVAFHQNNKFLLVSEHLAKRVWLLKLDENFEVNSADVYAEQPQSKPFKENLGSYTGPDGLRLDAHDIVYVAVYGAGRIAVFTPNGGFVWKEVPMPFVTSIALSEDRIAITGANTNTQRPYPGQVLVVDRKTFETADKVGF